MHKNAHGKSIMFTLWAVHMVDYLGKLSRLELYILISINLDKIKLSIAFIKILYFLINISFINVLSR